MRTMNHRMSKRFILTISVIVLMAFLMLFLTPVVGDDTTPTRSLSRSHQLTRQTDTPPVFLDHNVTPLKGDTDTDFVFSAWVIDPDGKGIASVQVVVDGNPLGMGLDFDAGGVGSNGSRYKEVINLESGEHTVYFKATDNDGSLTDTNATPLKIKVVRSKEEDNPYDRYICLVLIIIVTLVLMIWTFRQFKKRRDAQDQMFASDGGEVDTGIRCTECDKPVPEDAKECPHCKESFVGTEEVCPFCETNIPKGAQKCPLCKKRFKSEQEKGKDSPKFNCPHCEAVVDPGQKKCPGCDADISKTTTLKTKKGKAAEKMGEMYMCSICGGDVKESEPKCKKCGTKFA